MIDLLLAALADPLPLCAPPHEMRAELHRRYGEVPAWSAATPSGELVQVYQSLRGSWTLTVTQPFGLTCIIRAGRSGDQIVVGDPA